MADNDVEKRSGRELVLRGKAISEDQSGLICLDDIWDLSHAPDQQGSEALEDYQGSS